MRRAGVMVAVAVAAAVATGCHGGPGRCGRPTRAPRVEVVRCADGCGVPPPRVVAEVAPCPAAAPQPQVILAVPVGYPFPGGYPAAAPPAAAPAAPALTPDRVEAFSRRIEELEAQLRATQPAGGARPAGGK